MPDEEKTECDKCRGVGTIHTAENLAHEPEGCLWCEECVKCKGKGWYVPQLEVIPVPVKQPYRRQTAVKPPPPGFEPESRSKQQAKPVELHPAPDSKGNDSIAVENYDLTIKSTKSFPSKGNSRDKETDSDPSSAVVTSSDSPATPISENGKLNDKNKTRIIPPLLRQLRDKSSGSLTSGHTMERSSITAATAPGSRLISRASSIASDISTATDVSGVGVDDPRKSLFRRAERNINQWVRIAAKNSGVTPEVDHISMERVRVADLLGLSEDLKAISSSVLSKTLQVVRTYRMTLLAGPDSYPVPTEPLRPSNLHSHSIPDAFLLAHPKHILFPDEPISDNDSSQISDMGLIRKIIMEGDDPISAEMFFAVFRMFMTGHRLMDWIMSFFRVYSAPLPKTVEESMRLLKPENQITGPRLSDVGKGPSYKLSLGNRQLAPSMGAGTGSPNDMNPARTSFSEKRPEDRRKHEVLVKALKAYHDAEIPKIRKRAFNLLMLWIRKYWFDFEEDARHLPVVGASQPSLVQRLESFCQELIEGVRRRQVATENAYSSQSSLDEPEIYFAESTLITEAIRAQKLESASHLLMRAKVIRPGAEAPVPQLNLNDPNWLTFLKNAAENVAKSVHYLPAIHRIDEEKFALMLTQLEREQLFPVQSADLVAATMLATMDSGEFVMHLMEFRSADMMPNSQAWIPLQRILIYLNWFETICSWTTSLIVFPIPELTKPAAYLAQERCRMLKRLIKVAHICFSNRNFATSAAILVGITRPILMQLEACWMATKDRYIEMVMEMAQFFHHSFLQDSGDPAKPNLGHYSTEMENMSKPGIPLLVYELHRLVTVCRQMIHRDVVPQKISFKKIQIMCRILDRFEMGRGTSLKVDRAVTSVKEVQRRVSTASVQSNSSKTLLSRIMTSQRRNTPVLNSMASSGTMSPGGDARSRRSSISSATGQMLPDNDEELNVLRAYFQPLTQMVASSRGGSTAGPANDVSWELALEVEWLRTQIADQHAALIRSDACAEVMIRYLDLAKERPATKVPPTTAKLSPLAPATGVAVQNTRAIE